jgi:hypothetical protein
MKTNNKLQLAGDTSPPSLLPLFFYQLKSLIMKKSILLTIAVTVIFFDAQSQITKGNWMVGGNASYTHTNNDISTLAKYKNTTFSVAPNIGYFVWDKFCTGVKLSISFWKNDYPANSGGTISYSTKNQFYNLGPFVRYYFLQTDKRANLFVEGIYQHQLRKDISPSANSKQAANIYAINAGPVFYFNSSVGIELTIGYSSLKYNGTSGSNGTFQTNIGLQIHLEKDN